MSLGVCEIFDGETQSRIALSRQHSVARVKKHVTKTNLNACVATIIDREFVTSAKKFANFNEFSEIKKIRKNS